MKALQKHPLKRYRQSDLDRQRDSNFSKASFSFSWNNQQRIHMWSMYTDYTYSSYFIDINCLLFLIKYYYDRNGFFVVAKIANCWTKALSEKLWNLFRKWWPYFIHYNLDSRISMRFTTSRIWILKYRVLPKIEWFDISKHISKTVQTQINLYPILFITFIVSSKIKCGDQTAVVFFILCFCYMMYIHTK